MDDLRRRRYKTIFHFARFSAEFESDVRLVAPKNTTQNYSEMFDGSSDLLGKERKSGVMETGWKENGTAIQDV